MEKSILESEFNSSSELMEKLYESGVTKSLMRMILF